MDGLFNVPPPKDTALGKVGRFLAGFGAGYQGRGADLLAQQDQMQQQLDERRQKAMAQDAMRVYSSLNDGKYDDAIELIDDRVKAINELGGDASDTLEIRNLIVSGRLDEAQQELGGFLELAMQNGLIEAPKAPEVVPSSSVVNGQVITRDSAGNLVAQTPRGLTSPQQGFRMLSQQEVEAQGLDPSQRYQVDQGTGRVAPIGGGGVNVPVTVEASGPSSRFADLLDTQLAGYMEQASMSGGLMPKLQILEQLAPLTSEGQIPAAISRIFPNFNDANSAFMGIVSQTIPDMRVPGSGAQSDKDMEQIFNGFGNLAATPEVKSLLIEAMKNSASIKQERADIAQMYLEGDLTQAQAARRVREINSKSILPERLQGLLNTVGATSETVPQTALDLGITPQEYAQMTAQEKAAFNR